MRFFVGEARQRSINHVRGYDLHLSPSKIERYKQEHTSSVDYRHTWCPPQVACTMYQIARILYYWPKTDKPADVIWFHAVNAKAKLQLHFADSGAGIPSQRVREQHLCTVPVSLFHFEASKLEDDQTFCPTDSSSQILFGSNVKYALEARLSSALQFSHTIRVSTLEEKVEKYIRNRALNINNTTNAIIAFDNPKFESTNKCSLIIDTIMNHIVAHKFAFT